ncbi:MAG: CCDC90 family protein [Rhodospirillales bacterium]|nr:CCDC90 family protein [Rhodospirillales bacterium]
MSNVVPFDTLALALALRDEAGFDQKQAEGTARVLSRLLVADLATKADIVPLATKSDIEARLATTKADLEVRIAETKSDLLKSIVGMLIAAVTVNSAVVLGAMFGLAKLLGH